MKRNSKSVPTKDSIVFISVLLNVVIIKYGFMNNDWYWAFLFNIPMLVFAVIEWSKLNRIFSGALHAIAQCRSGLDFLRGKRPRRFY